MCEKLSPEGDSPDRWSRLTDKLESVEKALTARESELAEAKRRVVELEEALKLWMTYDGMGNPDPLSILLMARNATATLLRITRIPGKESDDGEMH